MYKREYKTTAGSRSRRARASVAPAPASAGKVGSRGKLRRGRNGGGYENEEEEDEEEEAEEEEVNNDHPRKKRKTSNGANQLQRSVSISRSPFLACVWRPSLSYLQKQPQCSFDNAIVPVLQPESQVSAPLCHLSNSCAQSLLPTEMGSLSHERAYWARF